MDLHSMSRKLVVLAFAAALLVGFAATASATVTINSAEIILVGDEEATGALGNGMLSIGDTIVVRVNVSPADSIFYVIADMRKYGGSEAETLTTYQGRLAAASGTAWVPTCSIIGDATMTDPAVTHPDETYVGTQHWTVCMDDGVAGAWIVTGSLTGTLPDTAWTDSLCLLTNGSNELFSFLVSDTADICCASLCDSCDHFEFETYGYIPADTIYTDTLVVTDAGPYWIDNTPCDYVGHDDPTALIIATNILYPDSSFAWDIDSSFTTVPEDLGGSPIDYDTHHTTYAQLINPGGAGAEFIEVEDYFYSAGTMNAGLWPTFGWPDNILNPTSLFGFDPDTLYAHLDMRRLSHANGNDDIYHIYWDAYVAGDTYADMSLANVDSLGWWFVKTPYYDGPGGFADCVEETSGYWEVWSYLFPIMPGSTDVDEDVAQLPMKWISDSGDTTYFPTFTNVVDAAIDNIIPDATDMLAAEPDTVTVDDIVFVAELENAGSPDYLNPASEGYETPDWLQVQIDLAGLYDLDDITYGFADMKSTGWYLGTDTPLGLDYLAPMVTPPVAPLAPMWGTDLVDILASPPSPYGWDQDVCSTQIWLFDDAGNGWYLGPKDTAIAIDNEIPYIDPGDCISNSYIYVEIAEDVALYTGYANVGEPTDNIYDENGNTNPLDDYTTRDKIIAHANIGDAFGVDEVDEVWIINDPFCVDSLILYDDGTNGDDPVAFDKNFTGHARVEVGNTLFCHLDTDEDSAYFDVYVSDDAGNAAILNSCIGVKYDNEIPTITADNVAIMFWDDPETFGVDGDVDGDSIVTYGDSLIFEWRAEDETWDDTEIDLVQVDAASIDTAYSGYITLYWNPSGGIYRNHWPDGPGAPYAIDYGSVDGEELCADFCVWDNAGNSTGWKNFCSGLTLDNMGTMIDCGDIAIAISGDDDVASVGDTITFTYSGTTDDLVNIGIVVGDLAEMDDADLNAGNGWTDFFVVEAGTTDTDTFTFDVYAEDDVGNEFMCVAGPIAADNQVPTLGCGNAYVRLWDYLDNVPDPIVNVGDNLTAIYFDVDGDVVDVTADFSNYGTSIGTDGVVDMVFGFDGGPEYKYGYRVDPVPEGTIDQGPGGLGTLVMLTVYDDAGNSNSAWFCPIWFDESVLPDPIATPADTTYACGAGCVGVDTQLPDPPDPESITFTLLENSNNIANVGDRLHIVVNMGDPTAPGYDMQWETSCVEADIGQYGYGEYIDLTDGGWSAGGEGDGKFSCFFFFNEDDGETWYDGYPILPGDTNLDAGDEDTKIRIRSMDDAGNYSSDWVWSDVLVHDVSGLTVPVDNEIPVIDPEDASVSFIDHDDNGILDIGDEVIITVDMTDAQGGPIAGLYAYLYDWGHPSMDMIPLTAHSPVYIDTFTVAQNEGEFCDGDLFEDEPCGGVRVLGAIPMPHPILPLLALDVSDNWSSYYWTGEPYVDSPPIVDDWPFTYAWPYGIEFDAIIADTDAPDPVNWTYEEGGFDSGISTYSLPDGRIGVKMFYETDPRNTDVAEFYVYGDIDTPGAVDWNTYLGAPIPAGNVPTTRGGMRAGDYAWISDMLPERLEAYHFGVLAVDNAGNMSDPDLTWITGEYADTSYFSGYVEVLNGDNQPVEIGGGEVDFYGYLNSEYWQVVYVEWYGRLKDMGSGEPSQWKLFEEQGEWPDGGWDYVEPPYIVEGIDLFEEFSLVEGSCYEFEIVIIPWDESGNHMTLAEAEQYATSFTYDDWPPVIQWWEIDGDPSPSAEGQMLSGSALVEAEAYDGCALNGDLTYVFYAIELGGDDLGDDLWLDTQTIPAGGTYSFTWDLAGYPAGDARIGLDVYDEAGNMASFDRRSVRIEDTWAPGGRFATVKLGSESHPEYTRLTDGMAIGSSEMLDLVFWVQWPGVISTGDYDVEQVKVEYMLHGTTEDWNHIATITSWGSTESWMGDVWYPYWFEFDTSGFGDGDQIDMKATVMDEWGNETAVTITVMIAGEAPILAIDIPEATEVCGEMRVKGPFNITATETETPYDTYFAFWAYKSSDEPDIDPDCDWTDSDGWIIPSDSLMLRDMVTPETIWRSTIDPSTEGMDDGSWDFVVLTTDVAGNWSWDVNGDGCIDPGYFAWAVDHDMGMTVVLQNEAPEVRIRSVNDFEPVDEGWLWPILVYAQTGDQVTVTSWTESDCDVDRIEYWLDGDDVINGEMLVATSDDEGDAYEATFPGSGGVGDYLVPGALQNGFVTVNLVARLYDVLGNYSEYWVDLTIISISPTSALITRPADGDYVGHMVELKSTVLSSGEIYDVTYYYRPADTVDWMAIATTRPHDGDPWDTDTNGDKIYWNTDLIADGAYELAAVARNANLITDPAPPVITVTVDNTPPIVAVDVDPKVVTTKAQSMTWIGGPFVEIMAGVTEAGGVEYCKFWYKPVEEDIGSATHLNTDYGAPFAFMWDGTGFTSVASGWYDIIAEVKDFAGNTTFDILTVYIDHCDPYGWIAQINDDQTPGGSNFFGVVTITGWMDDSDSDCSATNQLMHSGTAGAQFQYSTGSGWDDLGGFITGSGPDFTIDWDLSAMVGQSVSLRIAAVDAVGNWAYSDSVTIKVIDTVADKAVIAGVDPVTGYIWAVPVIHGTSEDIGFVRFEYGDGEDWTVIGTVDESTTDGLFGMAWHAASAGAGTHYVRAVAFHDDWDAEDPDFADLYDQDPAMMQVTVDEFGGVTMATTEHITSLERWGNLHNCDRIVVEAVSEMRPTIIVVYDNDPEDHFNTPSVDWRDELIRPDDPTVWVDNFSISRIDPWGNAMIIASYNDGGTVGAVTSMVNVYKIAGREGSRGLISQDGMTVDIPAGAFDGFDGLLMITVPDLVADPSLTGMEPVGHPVMMSFPDYDNCDTETFSNGVRATLTLAYDQEDVPGDVTEADLRIARWSQSSQKWIQSGIINPVVDQVNNTVTVLVDQTGTYSVVAATTFRIATPVFMPRCGDYTGPYMRFCSVIEDELYGIDTDEIKVVLDGPAEDLIFDMVTIYYDGSCANGFDADYDGTAHTLCVEVDDDYCYETLRSSYDGGWSGIGLPGGTYDLHIWAMNGAGEVKHLEHTFMVDDTPPTIAFTDEYGADVTVKHVDTYPVFYLMIDDLESGADLAEVYLDIFVVDPEYAYSEHVEDEERLGTITPSAMSYNAETGIITAEFGEIYRDELPEGLSLDVVVYNGHFTTCSDDDCEYGDCRCYYNSDGVADCAGNHATPVWRRFTVKREVPPGPVVVTDVKSFPNPFDPSDGGATIRFTLSTDAHVMIKIYDFAGEHVATVADDWYASGATDVMWYGDTGNGEPIATGAYIGYVKIDDGSKVVTKTLKIGVVNGGND